jgi:adenylate cyclase
MKPIIGRTKRDETRRLAAGLVLAGQIRRGMGETIRAVATSDGRPRIRYGLALHLGDVMYGNIGGDTRLDFTVIGPAVNLNSRMESMCKNVWPAPFASGCC